MSGGPYESSAFGYWDAGWRGVIPLPPGRKGPPPASFTGWAAQDTSRPDVTAWIEDQPDGNIGLHLPDGVIGLDVDHYGPKTGGNSLADAVTEYGELPDTWWSTSRDDGVSGIRLFRVPPGRRWPGSFGPHTETIHSGHRYVVAPPSVHPDTGRRYRWITPSGETSIAPPLLADLPELPVRWVVGMTKNREARVLAGAGMDDEEIRGWLHAHSHGDEPCERMATAAGDAIEKMRDGAHEALSQLMYVVGLAARGHDGLMPVLEDVRREFIHEVTRRGREHVRDKAEAKAEWSRSLFGAVDKVVAERIAEGWDDSRLWTDPCLSAEPTVIKTPDVKNPGHEDRGEQGPEPSTSASSVSDDQVEAVLTATQQRALEVEERRRFLSVNEEAKRALEAENAPPLRIMGFAEFLSAPEPEPIVERMFYRDSLARIFGKPGCGKSFLAMDVAFSVTLGRDWGGGPVVAGPVVYVMAEGQRVNTRRARAWIDRHKVDPAELEGKFWAVPDKVLLTEAAARPFVEKVCQLQPVLIILDTQNAMQVGEENSASDSRVMRDALDAMRHATQACVVLIGHSGKASDEAARGSNAVEGAMDTEIKVVKDDGHPPHITVEVTRDKADEAGKTWEFFLRHHPLEDGVSGAVLVAPDGEIGLPVRERRDHAPWADEHVALPAEVLGFEGLGKGAMPYVASYMAQDANPNSGDPGRIGITQAQAITAVKDAAGFEKSSVRRCWSWLRANGFIGPVDDKWDTNTTGKHGWLRT